MAENKETAEQKLLKMIEAGGSSGASKTQKKVARKQGFLSALKLINKVLIIGVIALVVLLFNQVRSGMALMSKKVNIKAERVASRRGMNAQDLLPRTQRLSYYLASVKSRNIFQPYEEKDPVSVVEAENKSRTIVKKTEDLRLVGIAWLDTVDSASAMIEDINEQKTYFLQKEEMLRDIQVKTIYADSVELGYDDEEIIIRYDKSQL